MTAKSTPTHVHHPNATAREYSPIRSAYALSCVGQVAAWAGGNVRSTTMKGSDRSVDRLDRPAFRSESRGNAVHMAMEQARRAGPALPNRDGQIASSFLSTEKPNPWRVLFRRRTKSGRLLLAPTCVIRVILERHHDARAV